MVLTALPESAREKEVMNMKQFFFFFFFWRKKQFFIYIYIYIIIKKFGFKYVWKYFSSTRLSGEMIYLEF